MRCRNQFCVRQSQKKHQNLNFGRAYSVFLQIVVKKSYQVVASFFLAIVSKLAATTEART
jgi:hypothetical protein